MNANAFCSRSSTIMSARVLVLGAAGRLGHAAARAFRDAGWSVASLVRPGSAARAPADTEVVEVLALDHGAVGAAARAADVVLHALNPSYTDWLRLALPLAYSAITAAETAGATLLFPGNLYNYGAPLPPVIDEATPMRPSSRKGQLRVAIEERMAEAAERGARVIILRAGDFFGGGRGAWLDLVIAQAIAKAAGRGLEVKRMTWWLVHALAPFLALPRELSEIAYLWHEPHRIAGDKLTAAIGEVSHTPLDVAVARALEHIQFV